MSSAIEHWVSNPGETRGPLVSITIWLLCGVSAGFLALRLYIRHSKGKLWLDDIFLGISWILLLVQVTLNQLTVNLGFGKHALDVNFSNFDRIAYYGAAALSVSFIATSLSKISFGVTLLRLTEEWPRRYVYFAMASMAIFAIPAAVLPWVLCKPLTKTFVDIIPGTCIDKGPSIQYGRFQAGWSALMDLSLAVLPWKILWKLQMRSAEKIGVCIAMSLGILAGAAAIIRASYVELLTTQDLSFDAYNHVIWSVADTAMTIVATSIPVLRVFFKQAVNSAIENYHNSSDQSKANTSPSNPVNTIGQVSLRRSSKRTTNTADSLSKESLVDVLGGRSKGYVELEDLVVDENTGRVTALTPESVPDSKEHKVSQWPL